MSYIWTGDNCRARSSAFVSFAKSTGYFTSVFSFSLPFGKAPRTFVLKQNVQPCPGRSFGASVDYPRFVVVFHSAICQPGLFFLDTHLKWPSTCHAVETFSLSKCEKSLLAFEKENWEDIFAKKKKKSHAALSLSVCLRFPQFVFSFYCSQAQFRRVGIVDDSCFRFALHNMVDWFSGRLIELCNVKWWHILAPVSRFTTRSCPIPAV